MSWVDSGCKGSLALGEVFERYKGMTARWGQSVFEIDKVFVPLIVVMFLEVSLTTMLKWVGRRIAP
jgi:ABC-type nitrate/sulfonate/bicarbonate transport system permease component